jgi:hypothetical protein
MDRGIFKVGRELGGGGANELHHLLLLLLSPRLHRVTMFLRPEQLAFVFILFLSVM